MNLLHGNKFSPWEDFFVNPFGSDVISPNPLCKCHVCTGAGRSTCGGTMKLIRFHSGSIIASLTWCLLVPIVVGIMSSVIITKRSKKRTRDK